MKRFFRKWVLDGACIWVLPIASSIGVITSAFLTYDFAKLILYAPNWKHQIDIVEALIPLVLFISQIVVLTISVLQSFRTESLNSLQSKLDDTDTKINFISNNIETLVDGLLLRVAEKLSLARGEASRLTIYIHNGSGYFISFGRYTPDPTYSGKGRGLLPDDEGCISQAWKSDWCYEGNLTYRMKRQKYKMDKEAVQNLRMNSTFYAVKRIDSSSKHPLAVLVFESTVANRFPESQIKSILDGEEMYLADVIHCLKDHIPNPQDATARGF